MKKKILVTGGAGYIGSHTTLQLIDNGFDVSVVDNLSNSSEESLIRVEKITKKKLHFYQCDLRDEKLLDNVFASNKFDSVIHFAGLKAVGESVAKPLLYYDNNINGSIVLLKLMQKYNVTKLVFSSSATVYGDPEEVLITEKLPVRPINPYGHTKAVIEQIIKDFSVSNKKFNAVILRYFNPVGAHESGMIGEDPNGTPNNLVPYIAQIAVGRLKTLRIFGGDYDTVDGTGVRDYVHIADLANAHIKALDKMKNTAGVSIYNLGTGVGCSVLEVVAAFEKASGKKIPYKVVGRRHGDAPAVFADPSLANRELNWVAKKGIFEMCRDVWLWQSKNPNGFGG